MRFRPVIRSVQTWVPSPEKGRDRTRHELMPLPHASFRIHGKNLVCGGFRSALHTAYRITTRLCRVLHPHKPMSKEDEGPFSWLEDIWKQIFCSASGTLSGVSAHRRARVAIFLFPCEQPGLGLNRWACLLSSVTRFWILCDFEFGDVYSLETVPRTRSIDRPQDSPPLNLVFRLIALSRKQRRKHRQLISLHRSTENAG
jgi:hypothetical protein